MKNANAHPMIAGVQTLLFSVLIRFKAIRIYLTMAGPILRHLNFVEENFKSEKLFLNRELLWKQMHKSMEGRPFQVHEFGVAWGYTTSYWFDKFDPSIASWDGYDRFSGLPGRFMFHPKGAFSNSGISPKIQNSKIRWHIGDVEETVGKDWKNTAEVNSIYFFDLDLYEPSLHVWNQISGQLKNGDLIYLDEAFSDDEYKLMTDHILKQANFNCVGYTLTSIAFAYTTLK